MNSLEGHRALVCGSTQGIGQACAHELARRGAMVILAARNEESLAEVLTDLKTDNGQQHHYIVADFCEPESVRDKVAAEVAEHGPIHVVVNNTGGPASGPLLDADPEELRQAMSAHLICNHLLAQVLVPGMKDASFGRIINIISISVKQPIAGLGVSNATRWAVASWAKTLAGELGPFGITVNNVLPGYTDTQRLRSLLQTMADRQSVAVEELEQAIKTSIPARRFADASEVAAAVGFLASTSAGYINGINLPVDGGRTECL